MTSASLRIKMLGSVYLTKSGGNMIALPNCEMYAAQDLRYTGLTVINIAIKY